MSVAVESKNVILSIFKSIVREYPEAYELHMKAKEDWDMFGDHTRKGDKRKFNFTNTYLTMRRCWIATQVAYWYQYGEYPLGDLQKDFSTEEELDEIFQNPGEATATDKSDHYINMFLGGIHYNTYTNAGVSFCWHEDMERIRAMTEVTEPGYERHEETIHGE